MAARTDRIGETRMMNCGMEATIVAYRKYSDIDVQFTDGFVRTGVSYGDFKNGAIARISASQKLKSNMETRLFETRTMRNGMMAKVIGYRKCTDIDVEFEDGTVIDGTNYIKFKNGEISNPNIKYKKATSIQEFAIRYYLSRIGFRKIEQGEWKDNGFGKQELDFYHQEANIAIEYDGGLHNDPDARERDRRKNKNCKKIGVILYRLRDPRLSDLQDDGSVDYVLNKNKQIRVGLIDCKDELEKILNAHNIQFDNIDIDFYRDANAIMDEYNQRYVNYYSNKRVGETVYNPLSNQNMTIVAYRSAKDMDVQFEDGTMRTNVAYKDFVDGNLRHSSKTTEMMAKQRIGETRCMNNGKNATIVAYRISEDIDVQFEDGSIRHNVTYDHFIAGKIGHPDTLRGDGARHRLGETRTMHCGLKATIIAYRKSHDIDVQFETGEIRHHTNYHSFKNECLLPENRLKKTG